MVPEICASPPFDLVDEAAMDGLVDEAELAAGLAEVERRFGDGVSNVSNAVITGGTPIVPDPGCHDSCCP